MARTTATVSFQALELKGSLLPASLLEEVSKFNRPKKLLLEQHDYVLGKGGALAGVPPRLRATSGVPPIPLQEESLG